jgi:hypothetical protein
MFNYLEAKGIESRFDDFHPARSSKGFIGEDSERVSSRGNGWMALDVISFVIRFSDRGFEVC